MARPGRKSQSAAAESAAEASPFLKWAGGKRQLLGKLLAHVPESFGTYHEPFVGGGALFFKLRALERLKQARLSDVNPELVNAWTMLRDATENVLAELEKLASRTDKESFYAVRALDPAALTGPERAARIIYLNKTCFNGLYRENSKGIFNVPYGDNGNPRVLDRPNLLAVARALKGVTLTQGSFSVSVKHARPGDFFYFDPPYHPVSGSSSFTAYSRGGFGVEGQQQLARVFGELAEMGVHVLLSNSDTPLIRELYEGRGFEITRVEASRAINCNADRRGPVGELIIKGGQPKPRRAVQGPAARQLPIDL